MSFVRKNKNRINLFRRASLLLVSMTALLLSRTAGAQSITCTNGNCSYVQTVSMSSASAPATDVYMPDKYTWANGSCSGVSAFQLNRKVKSAYIHIKYDTGEDYVLGSGAWSSDLSFTLTPVDNLSQSIEPVQNLTISITQVKPEAAYSRDITALLNSGLRRFTLTSNSATFSGALSAQAQSRARIKIEYKIEYGWDATASAVTAVAVSSPQTSRTVSFSWSNNCKEFPGYQFQLVRLYNQDPTRITDEKDIQTVIDWGKALTMETESDKTLLKLSVAEGTGYYAWRVRPIGSYYDGGITNPSNWGGWNVAASAATVTINNGSIPSHVFFFQDPDDDKVNNKNYIYNRAFTEEGKVHEGISYANGLEQMKQTQSRTPSTNTTIISQQVTDFSGRPTLTSIPAPVVENELDRYKDMFMQPDGSTETYRDKHFDNNTNLTNPDKVKETTTGFDYYKDNADKSIPNAEGYPYNRTVYTTDGTGRVTKQSMPGDAHKLSGDHTIRTYYELPSDKELIRIFGDEAPKADQVLKTIAVDQNGVASISYTAKDGKVIATCLEFDESSDPDLMPLDGETLPAFEVADTATCNTRAFGGAILSGKRLSFTKPSPIGITYTIPCKTIESGCATGECQFRVQVIVHNLDDPTLTRMVEKDLSTVTCVNGLKTIYVDCDDLTSGVWTNNPTNLTDLNAHTCVLPAGNYMIEKRLYATNRDNFITGVNTTELEWVTSAVTKLLVAVKDYEDLPSFYTNVLTFNADLTTARTCNVSTPGDCNLQSNPCALLKVKYGSPFICPYSPSALAKVGLKTRSGAILYDQPADMGAQIQTDPPEKIHIESQCCPSFDVPIEITPPLKCPETDWRTWTWDPVNLNINTGAGSPALDFEQFAFDYLKTYYPAEFTTKADIAALFKKEYKLGFLDYPDVRVFREGEFNKMIFHMVTDKYSACDVSSNGCSTTTGDCPGGVMADCHRYECDDLIKCWLAALEKYRQSKDVSNLNVLDAMDEDDLDDALNSLPLWIRVLMFKPFDFLNPKDAADYIKDEGYHDVPTKFDLLGTFLECTGYQYVKIIFNPMHFQFAVNSTIQTCDKEPFAADQADWDLNSHIFEFKYYQYPKRINVTLTAPLPMYVNDVRNYVCERIYSMFPTGDAIYDDDGQQYTCPPLPKTTRDYKEWTCIDRANFARCTENAVMDPELQIKKKANGNYGCGDFNYFDVNNPVECPAIGTCPEETAFAETVYNAVINAFKASKDTCLAGCDNRRPQVERNLREALLNRCYTIGGCEATASNITESMLQYLVDQFIVEKCRNACVNREIVCTDVPECYFVYEKDGETRNKSYSMPLIEFGNPCQQLEFDQASYWSTEFDVAPAPGCPNTTNNLSNNTTIGAGCDSQNPTQIIPNPEDPNVSSVVPIHITR